MGLYGCASASTRLCPGELETTDECHDGYMFGDDGKVREAHGEHDVTENKDDEELDNGYIVGTTIIQDARLELDNGDIVFDEGVLRFDDRGQMMFSGVEGTYDCKRASISRHILGEVESDGYTVEGPKVRAGN